jgi:UDPglucose 6-dehydrogenase
MVVTNLSTAELIKHAANAFLATKISFINLVSDFCEGVDGDITQVAEALGLDPRIGPQFLKAGIGYGGYCLPKDLQAFIHLGEEHGVDCTLLRAIAQINKDRVERITRKVQDSLWVLHGKVIGVLGLAFKGGTDDLRESQAVKVVRSLAVQGAQVQIYDPQAGCGPRDVVDEPVEHALQFCSSAYAAAEGAHVLLVLTDWEEFRALDWHRLKQVMQVPMIIDGRNHLNAHEVSIAGFEYISMGRRTVHPAPEEVQLQFN